ncbi:ribonuclease J [Myxococcota bacterium]|nr:ribonuclease J [Myxococcota bacterium]
MKNNEFKVIPLGGLGHVGGNMMVYETAKDLLVIDCGVLFPSAEQPGVDYIIPDITYLKERRKKLRGIILTHGHEDHIGALPYVLPELGDIPIYSTGLTLALLKGKMREFPDVVYTPIKVEDYETFDVGGFSVEAIPFTHSIPDAIGLVIDTPIGKIFHTGDFRLDHNPIDNRKSGLERLRELGKEGISILLSDSTNSEKPGHTWGEREVAKTLNELVEQAENRVFFTTFSSNMHRLQIIIDAAERVGRKIMPVGRSVDNYLAIGKEEGFIKIGPRTLVDSSDYNITPRDEVVLIVAGSQGEPRSAMTRVAKGAHKHVKIEQGDTVIMSSRRIPGNERPIGKMVDNMVRQGATVLDDRAGRVHASGHAFNDEQVKIIDLVRPEFFVPIHGEFRFMARHAALAIENGVAPENAILIEDGIPLSFNIKNDELIPRRLEPVQSGLVFVDGKGIGDVGEIVLHDRRILSKTGIIMCVAIRDESGEFIAGPEIITRGVVHIDESQELLGRATEEVRSVLTGEERCLDDAECAEEIRLRLRRFFRRELDRRPLIIPVVMTV